MADKEVAPEVQHYLSHIAAYDREFAPWETRSKKIIKRYRDDTRTSQDTGSRFNILWSNVQTLKAATFARLPKPDVSRRFRDQDAVGRVASLILERALDYEINHYNDYRETLTAATYDRFLGGRGIGWVRYEPKFKPGEDAEFQVSEDEENESEELDYECAPTDYVHWRDFGHSVARTWEETCMVWRKVYMTRPMLRERFGEIADKVPLDAQPEEMKNVNKEGVDKRALVYEIWDKETGKAIWLSKSLNQVLDEKDDPLGLENFYPCPKPLYSTITNDSLVPVPDFALYQDQANALDTLSDRIDGLVKALQVKGVYDASEPSLARLFSEANNNSLIPVNNWNAFAEKKGLSGAIDLVDIQPIAQTLIQAYQAFDQVKNQVYDITGISDIVRGQSVASETATAQQIKGQYATLRLKSMQDDVARFATSLIQMKAQIICKEFDEQTILSMAAADQLSQEDQQMIPQALELLRNEPMRSFRIEISTDSMIQMDEAQEKQDRMEFLGAVSGFLEKTIQASQMAPQVVPLALDMLKFGVAGFKVGKSMEGQIDQTAEKFKQELTQKQQQPPQPDPEQMKQQAMMQMEQAKQQQTMQMEQMRTQADQTLTAAKFDHEKQIEQMKEAADFQKAEMIEQYKQQTAVMVENIKHQNEMGVIKQNQQATIDEGVVNTSDELKSHIFGQVQDLLKGFASELFKTLHDNKNDHEIKINEVIAHVTAPRKLVRGADGKVQGVDVGGVFKPVIRNAQGSVEGI